MDASVTRRAEATAAMAETLGLDVESARAAVSGGSGEALGDFLLAAAVKVKGLAEAERQARETTSGLKASGLAFASTNDPVAILEALLDYLGWLVPNKCASVLVAGREGRLELGAVREWRRSSRRGPTPVELSLAGEVIEARESRQCEVGSLRCLVLPLLSPAGPLGAVLILRDSGPYSEDQVKAAEAFAAQAASAVRNARLLEELKRAKEELLAARDSSLLAFARTLDLRHRETEGHSLRVADLAARLGAALGLEGEALSDLRLGALLHDVGKAGIPESILLKPGPLDAGEFKVLQDHPDLARSLLEDIPSFQSALVVPCCHHERWDGRGYPKGLSGEAIPLAARIFAVVDVWDALVHDRPYRKAMSETEARRYIATLAGGQLDPSALEAFLALPTRTV